MFVFFPSWGQTSTIKPAPSFETFTKIPDEIDGCSCTFSKNQLDFNNEKYIYANDYAEIAFISINKKLVKFKLVSMKGNVSHYSNKDYKLRIDIKSEKPSGEESSILKGIMTLTNKQGQKTITNFTGECGC